MRSNFQSHIKQLLQQQCILKGLGFYTGALDGIWGPKSIAAMRQWESTPSFKPAIPNDGMPLSDREPLPTLVTKKRISGSTAMLLHHPSIYEEPIAEETKVSTKTVDKPNKQKGETTTETALPEPIKLD